MQQQQLQQLQHCHCPQHQHTVIFTPGKGCVGELLLTICKLATLPAFLHCCAGVMYQSVIVIMLMLRHKALLAPHVLG